MMKTTTLLLTLLGLATVPAQTPPDPAPGVAAPSVVIPALPKPPGGGLVEYIHEVEVGTGGGRPMHIEIVLPKVRPAQPMPAVVWMHGGGLRAGSYKGNSAAFLAPYGYVAVSIEYRFIGESLWPAQIEDCKQAVRYLRANAAKYNLDPNAIGAFGHSSGAQLASLLGTMDDAEANGDPSGVSSRVAAVVEMAGPNDATLFPPNAREAIFGKDKMNDQALLKSASPVHRAKAGNAPFLILHGEVDKSVPIAVSTSFRDALEKAGVPVKLVIVKGADHGLNAPKDGPPPEISKEGINALILDFFEKNLRKTGS